MTLAFSPEQLLAALRGAPGRPPFPTRADRRVWAALRDGRLGQQALVLASAALAEPTPPIRATDYLAFARDGAREPFGTPSEARRARLMLMALGECLEGEGRFLDALLDEAWAICEQSTWVIPAHSGEFPHQLPPPEQRLIDLFSAITALTLAEIDYLLGDALHPALRARIRREVSLRSTAPFLARDDFHWLGTPARPINNWMAVCAGCTAAAALYLEQDDERLVAVLAKAVAGLDRYLASFGADGACAEGPDYWEFGFFHFVVFAHLLAERTEGRVDLLADPRVQAIAAFPAAVELSPGRFVTFSDAIHGRVPLPALLHFLAARLDLPALAALDPVPPEWRALTERHPAARLRDLFWYPAEAPPAVARPVLSYLPSVQWLVARTEPTDPNGLVLAVKGGNNGEPHNQNDVGAFIVHWRGEQMVADLGAGRYVRDYFDPARRYTFLTNRSLGHSVPLANRVEQRAGAAYAAGAVRRLELPEGDGLELDLAGAYPPEAGLQALRRTVLLRRAPVSGVVELVDHVVFAHGPGQFASVLVSFLPADPILPGLIVLSGVAGRLLIRYDAEQLEPVIERLPNVELKRSPSRDVTRIVLVLKKPTHEAEVRIILEPIE